MKDYIVLEDISRLYPNKKALDHVNLTIKKGEFLVILGASGSGKSTLLNIISGLDKPSTGKVYLRGELSNKKLPSERNISMIFQSNSLYPHMTIYQNLEFGLKIRKEKIEERKRKIEELSAMLKIQDKMDLYPSNLSGGEQQRVALGRAILKNADIFLFDEPLSDLDVRSKEEIREEITKIYKKRESTFIYVTHDQREALSLASKIVILQDGKIVQHGNSQELYKYPDNISVAEFLGDPKINLIHDTDKKEIIGIRPEHICLQKPNKVASLELKGQITKIIDFGREYKIDFTLKEYESKKLVAIVNKREESLLKNLRLVYIPLSDIIYFNPVTGKNLNFKK